MQQTYLWRPEEELLLRLLLPTNTYREISEQIARRYDQKVAGFPCYRTSDAVRKKCMREQWTPENVVAAPNPVANSLEALRAIQQSYTEEASLYSVGLIEEVDVDRKILSMSDIHFPLARIDLLEKIITEHADADVCVLNGDIMEGYVFSAYAKDRRIAAVHEYQASFEFIKTLSERFPEVVLISGNHDCLDEATQCLTLDGWKSYSQLTTKDHVLALDPATETADWTAVENVHVYNYDEDMVEITTEDGLTMKVTPNHRVMHKQRSRDQAFQFTKPSAFTGKTISQYIPIAGINNNEDYGFGPDVLAMFATYLCRPKSLTNTEEQLMTHMSGGLSPINARFLPVNLWNVSSTEFEQLLNFAAWTRTSDDLGWVLRFDSEVPERNQRIAAQFAGLLAMNGYASVPYVEGGAHCITTRPQNFSRITGGFEANARIVPYKGRVWCLTVAEGNFFVKRDGQSFFTGNSRVSRNLKSQGIEQEAIDVLRPDLIARMANGERLDATGMLVEKLDFTNVHYDRHEPWYARIGKAAFVHPHGRGSGRPGATAKKAAQYLSGRYNNIDCVVSGHTHKLFKGIEDGQLLIEQGHLSGLMRYAHSPKLEFGSSTYNGYATVYQDADGNTDFNRSGFHYLGSALPPKKNTALQFKEQ